MKNIADFQHLTSIQEKILNILSQEKAFTDSFFFTGGTLLKALGIVPRESNDLDFFTFSHIKPEDSIYLLKPIRDVLKRELGEKNLKPILKGFLHKPSGMLIEFIADSFPAIDNFVTFGHLKTAGLKDIAAHKASALCSRDELKDLIDIAFLTKKKGWLLKDLAQFAKKKFGIGTMPEEKLFEELLAKKNMFSLIQGLFLSSGKEHVKTVEQQIDLLLHHFSV